MNNRPNTFLQYLFVALLGVLLHFTYEWSQDNTFVGFFSSVNESTWEHLKLLFFPMLLLTVWNVWKSKEKDSYFLPARTAGILAGMGFIVTAYYTITGIIGKNVDWINVVIFLLGVAFTFWIEKKVYKKKLFDGILFPVIILTGLLILFIFFTIIPPEIGLFKDRS